MILSPLNRVLSAFPKFASPICCFWETDPIYNSTLYGHPFGDLTGSLSMMTRQRGNNMVAFSFQQIRKRHFFAYNAYNANSTPCFSSQQVRCMLPPRTAKVGDRMQSPLDAAAAC